MRNRPESVKPGNNAYQAWRPLPEESGAGFPLSASERWYMRLQGIDAPERDQPHGKDATAALKGLIRHRRVRLEIQGTDRYDRLIAVIYSEGRNVNR